jgi:EAL domain-containing protein (putative c-di-GMP-specific phosphodiesterase class I)/DNA-binding NarL/FixJ family response regulator
MPKILVIEDEESVRENLIDLLAAEDFETIAAANGKIGLDLAVKEIPDLILCDMMMPELDGYGVLTALRQDPLTATIPFIFLTAKSAKSDFRQGMDMGADDYLTKPFTRAELLSAIIHKLEKYASFKRHLANQGVVNKLNPRMQLIEMHLHRAVLQENFVNFQVYYQPIIDINTGKIIAAESLLRWEDSDLGFISPAEFIPLAESSGLIVPIGKWVLEKVCQQVKSWREAGLPNLTIAVNLSAIEFNQPDLVGKVINLISANSLDPTCLELEITESMIMHDVTGAIATMKSLRSLGIKIAVDDFGTGYSSLIYLKQFPINTLKLDRYFIEDVANDFQKSAIIKALIEMGHNLNLKIIAEGVETKAELEFLRQHNCDAIQGFLFSRPLPTAEFEKLLRDK